MKHVVFAAVLAASGCSLKYVTPATVPPGEARVEDRALPPDPATEPLPEGIPEDQRAEALDQGDKAPFSGLLIGEGKAARALNFKIRYVELRADYIADRKVWAAHRELYETRLVLADKAIRDLQPSWWDRNAASLGVIGGLVLGVALTGAAAALAN